MTEIQESILEGITLDKDNAEFNLALEYCQQTNLSIYLTGKAGSGKTTFLKYLREVSDKQMAVLAPTGVAAINAGGQTIHSFFQIPPSVYYPEDNRLSFYSKNGEPTIFDNFIYSSDKMNIIRSLQLLVIDEVSMVRADLMDVIDALLRAFRNSSKPFGGVQLLLIGDLYQLPPVVVDEEKDILCQFYETEFFFSSKALQKTKLLYVELKKIYRQSDVSFIDLLNRIRVNTMLPSDFEMLRTKLDVSKKLPDNFIVLATTNAKVTSINEQRLAELDAPSRAFDAIVEGEFPEKDMPTEMHLVLKEGAQVMFVKNDKDKRYFNGKIGVVRKITNENLIKVEIINKFNEKIKLDIEKEKWDKVRYSWNQNHKKIESEIIGTFQQFPLRLAWAVTVHKSQGLTFENVVADLKYSFSPGQVYVALSRCISFDGLLLSSEITPRSIFTDKRVMEFAKKEVPLSVLQDRLGGEKADYYYSLALKAFHELNSDTCLEYLNKALMYRDETGSSVFNRFTRVWLKRFMGLISRLDSVMEENRILKKKIEKMEKSQNLFLSVSTDNKQKKKNKNKKKKK